LEQAHWPDFLIDMLPQGFGRQELLRRIGRSATAGVDADWKLLLVGAGNPIGNLRVQEATNWLTANAGPLRGFTDDEVAQRGDNFSAYLASQGLFVAGSSGIQGEWPKILLTRAATRGGHCRKRFVISRRPCAWPRTMQDIEQERSDGTVQTMSRIFGMLELKLSVARTAREPSPLAAGQDSSAAQQSTSP